MWLSFVLVFSKFYLNFILPFGQPWIIFCSKSYLQRLFKVRILYWKKKSYLREYGEYKYEKRKGARNNDLINIDWITLVWMCLARLSSRIIYVFLILFYAMTSWQHIKELNGHSQVWKFLTAHFSKSSIVFKKLSVTKNSFFTIEVCHTRTLYQAWFNLST